MAWENVGVEYTIEIQRKLGGITTRDQAQALADSEISRRFAGYRLFVLRVDVEFDESYEIIGLTDSSGVVDIWTVDATLRCERNLAKLVGVYQQQYGFCPDPAGDAADREFLGGPVRFRVHGTCHGYAFEDTKTGEIREIGDGVDAVPDGLLESHEDMVVLLLQESLNFDQAETIEAYGLRE